jgi:hypothetical protein
VEKLSSKSKSHYDRQSGAHLGLATNFTFALKFASDSCGFVIFVAPSLTRGRSCENPYNRPDLQRTAESDTHTKVVRVYFQRLWDRLLTLCLYWLISICDLFVPFSVLCPSAEFWRLILINRLWCVRQPFTSDGDVICPCRLHLRFIKLPSFIFGWSVCSFAGLPNAIRALYHQDGKHFSVREMHV